MRRAGEWNAVGTLVALGDLVWGYRGKLVRQKLLEITGLESGALGQGLRDWDRG